jgi:hypothetical protein
MITWSELYEELNHAELAFWIGLWEGCPWVTVESEDEVY